MAIVGAVRCFASHRAHEDARKQGRSCVLRRRRIDSSTSKNASNKFEGRSVWARTTCSLLERLRLGRRTAVSTAPCARSERREESENPPGPPSRSRAPRVSSALRDGAAPSSDDVLRSPTPAWRSGRRSRKRVRSTSRCSAPREDVTTTRDALRAQSIVFASPTYRGLGTLARDPIGVRKSPNGVGAAVRDRAGR
jgi:hypothetical protein